MVLVQWSNGRSFFDAVAESNTNGLLGAFSGFKKSGFECRLLVGKIMSLAWKSLPRCSEMVPLLPLLLAQLAVCTSAQWFKMAKCDKKKIVPKQFFLDLLISQYCFTLSIVLNSSKALQISWLVNCTNFGFHKVSIFWEYYILNQKICCFLVKSPLIL